MQGEMVQNAGWNAAKRKAKSINIRCNCINKTFQNHEKYGLKGQNRGKKNGSLGVKWGQLDLKKHEHSTKIERQNGAKRELFSQKETKQKT